MGVAFPIGRCGLELILLPSSQQALTLGGGMGLIYLNASRAPHRVSSQELLPKLTCTEPDLFSVLTGAVSGVSAWAPELIPGSTTGAVS